MKRRRLWINLVIFAGILWALATPMYHYECTTAQEHDNWEIRVNHYQCASCFLDVDYRKIVIVKDGERRREFKYASEYGRDSTRIIIAKAKQGSVIQKNGVDSVILMYDGYERPVFDLNTRSYLNDERWYKWKTYYSMDKVLEALDVGVDVYVR